MNAVSLGDLSQAEIALKFDLNKATVKRIAQQAKAGRAKTTSGQVVNIRLSVDELSALDQLISEKAELKNRSHALRRMVREATGFLEVDADTLEVWNNLSRQLKGVATNINQMAKASNRGQLVWTDDESADMALLRREVGLLSKRFSQAVKVASFKSSENSMLAGDG